MYWVGNNQSFKATVFVDVDDNRRGITVDVSLVR